MADDEFYTLVPFKPDGFFWGTVRGEISLGRLARVYEAFMSHPDYVPGTDELVDFTQSSIEAITKREIELIRQFMVQSPEQHHCKSVLIVGSKFEFGLSRMLGLTMDQDVPVDRFVCHTVREALDWLRPGRADELIAAHEKALGSLDAPGSSAVANAGGAREL